MPLTVLSQRIYISCSSLSERKGQPALSVIKPQQPQDQAGLSENFCVSPLLFLPTALVFKAVRIPHWWELSHTGLH